jgi:flagellar FliJ protein
MAKSGDRLDGILQIAESKENTAAAAYSKQKQDWDFNQAKLDELRAFRDEYQGWSGAQSASQFQSTRQFLSQLSVAIDQQEQQVEQLLEQVQSTEADWSDRRRERMSVEKAIEKRAVKQDKQQARLEQNMLDELGNRPSVR